MWTGRYRRERGAGGQTGWTLIELVVVMAIITVLAAIATVGAGNAVKSSKEATLREDLFRMRDAIDQYYADKGKYPSDLQALVSDHYMREVPLDPISRSRDSWQTIPAEPDPQNPSADPGIFNVKSGAEGISLQGEAFTEF
jgi:prepilin-type N-terminal cleavage/methylation domain-containing protein